MSTEAEPDAITQTRGTCPICSEDGKTFTRQLHGLASHLMREHTVDQLVYQSAGEAVIDALDEAETPKLATGGLVKGPGQLVGDSIRAHLSPSEALLPGPNGTVIHIRGAYGDQPAEVTEIDMDDIEGDDQ